MRAYRTQSLTIGVVVVFAFCWSLHAAGPAADGQRGVVSRDILSRSQWKRVDEAVDSGLRFLATQQREDGLLFNLPIGHWTVGSPAHTAIYNHCMAGLMLGEVYGMSETRQHEPIRRSISKALKFTFNHQSKFHRHEVEQGGWRYVTLGRQRDDADLSITAWQLLFLRSARNSEFEVPKERIDAAMGYVRRSFNEEKGTFTYAILFGRDATRAMAGAGIVSLAMGGEHDSRIARQAGDWVLSRDFERYNRAPRFNDRYHYGVYYCSQAMFQLGGRYWSEFYPGVMKTLVGHQRADGSWDRESASDGGYGNAYTTALAILSLTPPYEILPIYQR